MADFITTFVCGVLESGSPRIAHDHESVHQPSPNRRMLRGAYDLAQTNDGNRRHWASTDAYDADSANSVAVRRSMTQRSRMETANNGFTKGITRTQANYTVGRGPTLRMQTRSPRFNSMVEDAWTKWAKRVKLARKLRTAVKSRVTDGEAFLRIKPNPSLPHPVKFDLVGIECDQVASTDLFFADKNRVDGIWFDEFGNPTHYDILPRHPGSQTFPTGRQVAEKVEAKYIYHLFQEERAGQHRAIPEMSSTLPLGAQSRRFRESTLTAGENIADLNIFIKTETDPDIGPGRTLPFDTLEIEKGMMTALPAGGDAFQARPEQPAATYEGFLRTQVGEQARPLSMSYSLAACDSSNANFASAKLDQHPFHFQVDVDQADAEDLVLDPLFEFWFSVAAFFYGWVWDLEANPVPNHDWGWPAMPIINEVDMANADKTNISTGISNVPRIQAERGYVSEKELANEAAYYGVTVDEMRAKHFASDFAQQGGAPTDSNSAASDKQSAATKSASSSASNRLPANRIGNGKARTPA